MKYYYSHSTGGFYNSVINQSGIPEDAVEITDQQRCDLREAEVAGKIISIDDTGRPVAVDRPPPSIEEAASALSAEVQLWLDTTAQTNGYDSIASCVSYRGSSVARWNDDAVAAVAWRDAVWQAAFQWQEDALANPLASLPTSQEVIAQLPQPAAFGWITHQPGASS